MFHIAFTIDEKYIKYCAVTMTSIVKHTDTTLVFKDFFTHLALDKELENYARLDYESLSQLEQKEGYVFHIIINAISEHSRAKLKNCIDELNKIYPCELEIHLVDDKLFEEELKVPKWKNCYAAYYNLLVGDFVSAQTCLFIDADMLVMKDIRMLFSLDFKDKSLITAYIFENNTNNLSINSGFIYFNLKHWNARTLKQKCLEFAKNPNRKIYSDQDIFNAICANDTLKIPIYYNYWLQTHDSDKKDIFAYEDFKQFKQRVKIIHYIRPKPWLQLYDYMNFRGGYADSIFYYNNYLDLWWEMASKTPVFKEELLDEKIKLNVDFAYKLQKLAQEKKKLEQEKINLLTINKHTEQKLAQELLIRTGAKQRIYNHLSYKMGMVMIENSKSLLGYIRMPYVLSYIKDKHKEEQRIYQEKIKNNPSLKLPPLETYADYKEALKLKEHLSYKLGEAFIKAYNNRWKGGGGLSNSFLSMCLG
ncbi:hypothetical protein GW575_08730 [Campylobacter sp. MIT 19-121]|uniref:glycosyltransferase family 8 protein n=1 Tax=Campylobacter sp. MIT 19-121 TaxID=2703906 RepID=UPI001389AFDB|nr:glycosyltransferase [Campylobacter sp. MIT 19-121]NDJ28022.1 hypothetical protein [Campylobacter sp. MIT 19-121]